MEINEVPNSILWQGGDDDYRRSPEYLQKMMDIEKEMDLKYSNLLNEEQNFFSRLLLKVKREIAIYQRKKEVKGFKNLYFGIN